MFLFWLTLPSVNAIVAPKAVLPIGGPEQSEHVDLSVSTPETVYRRNHGVGSGFRCYDPSLQRWINQDPIGEARGINLSGFVHNDHVNLVDTDGRIAWTIVGESIGAGLELGAQLICNGGDLGGVSWGSVGKRFFTAAGGRPFGRSLGSGVADRVGSGAGQVFSNSFDLNCDSLDCVGDAVLRGVVHVGGLGFRRFGNIVCGVGGTAVGNWPQNQFDANYKLRTRGNVE